MVGQWMSKSKEAPTMTGDRLRLEKPPVRMRFRSLRGRQCEPAPLARRPFEIVVQIEELAWVRLAVSRTANELYALSFRIKL